VRVRLLTVVLLVQVAIGIGLVAVVLSGDVPLVGDLGVGESAESSAPAEAAVPRAPVDRFDEARAFGWLRRQVELGPRPAGSPKSRRLARLLRAALPGGRFQAVPGRLRNVIGLVPGRDPARTVVVGAHYDTKDERDFVGANDAGSGTAVVMELARVIRPRMLRPTVVFILFDGEESPRGSDDEDFEAAGLRGSKIAAPAYGAAEAMILLDFVGNRNLSIAREANSDPALWYRLRQAAGRVGAGRAFPRRVEAPVSDDHLPFIRAGVPSVDLIDSNFLRGPCWHQTCDDLRGVSARSLDLSGETVFELLRTL